MAIDSVWFRSVSRLGIISDTHGLLRPEVLPALAGADLILHAGDIGDPGILESLRAVAPLVAVRGNNDRGAWADGLPEQVLVYINERRFALLHDANTFLCREWGGAPDFVVAGHSHRPEVGTRDGVAVLNPGSAGPRRFRLPVTLMRVQFDGPEPAPEIVTLVESP